MQAISPRSLIALRSGSSACCSRPSGPFSTVIRPPSSGTDRALPLVIEQAEHDAVVVHAVRLRGDVAAQHPEIHRPLDASRASTGSRGSGFFPPWRRRSRRRHRDRSSPSPAPPRYPRAATRGWTYSACRPLLLTSRVAVAEVTTIRPAARLAGPMALRQAGMFIRALMKRHYTFYESAFAAYSSASAIASVAALSRVSSSAIASMASGTPSRSRPGRSLRGRTGATARPGRAARRRAAPRLLATRTRSSAEGAPLQPTPASPAGRNASACSVPALASRLSRLANQASGGAHRHASTAARQPASAAVAAPARRLRPRASPPALRQEAGCAPRPAVVWRLDRVTERLAHAHRATSSPVSRRDASAAQAASSASATCGRGAAVRATPGPQGERDRAPEDPRRAARTARQGLSGGIPQTREEQGRHDQRRARPAGLAVVRLRPQPFELTGQRRLRPRERAEAAGGARPPACSSASTSRTSVSARRSERPPPRLSARATSSIAARHSAWVSSASRAGAVP